MSSIFRMILAAGALVLTAPAFAEDTTASLRQPAIDACVGGEASADGPGTNACTCMIDKIIADFGDDALPMLKIVAANLQPSQEAEIAALLGITVEEAKVLVKRLDEKMDPVMGACLK